ncbi:MAG: hypothetical protein M1830_007457 [Pleopsidium flavum]|nr:MAG: hypothetical protein M1830_007457 [Pleopsidium flavum]
MDSPTPPTKTTPTTTANPDPTPPHRPLAPARKNISFSNDKPSLINKNDTNTNGPSPIPITKEKWTAEKEAQLVYAQGELERSQRRWSRGQEEWVFEVEKLLEMKKEYGRFVKRRAEMGRKEGRRCKRRFSEVVGASSASVGEGSEVESGFGVKDEGWQETSKAYESLIRRVSSAKSAPSVDGSTRTTRTNSVQSYLVESPRQVRSSSEHGRNNYDG